MAQDAAASGAQSDADSSKGDKNSDAGTTGDSQPDIDKIVAARLRSKYGDLDELRAKASEYDKLRDSQKTETEKLTERIAALEREKVELENAGKQERIRSQTVRTAAKLGFADPEDAYALLSGSVEPDGSNIEKLLADLLKAKPYLSNGRVTGSADGGQQGQVSNGTPSFNELIRAVVEG